MRTRITFGIGMLLVAATANGHAQEIAWRAAQPAPTTTTITLGQPTRLSSGEAPAVARGQIGEPPPAPPPFPGGGPAVSPVPDGTAIFNNGMVNNDADLGGFWTRVGDKFRRCYDDVAGGIPGAFQAGPNRQPFASDCDFQVFSSPVSNPFFFEDPRALTEIRPVFIWQNTPNANPIFNGGNNFHYALRGSVAITPHISFVVSRLGFTTANPRNPTAEIQSGTGFSEILLGPKVTFIRNETSNTVAAIGLTFDVSAGSNRVAQDTGDLGLVPYFSIAQNFGKSSYGSFNFMNTTGYAFRTDNTRSESIYSSFHLDYEIGKRFYPMIEANYRHYTRNGAARNINFEGSDLTNYGSSMVSGRDELTLAVGGRVKINTFIWFGLAAEFNVLNNGAGQHLDQFRLTTDLIFRY